MAKRRSSSSREARRDIPTIASRRLSGRQVLPAPVRVTLPRRPPYSVPGTDGRVFNPAPTSFYKLVSGAPARVVAPPPRKPLPARSRKPQTPPRVRLSEVFQSVPASLLFSHPKRALVCIRRSVRRQVLAARGSLGANRYRKPTDSVRC